MASKGRGRRGCPLGTLHVFDQRAFIEAMGVAAAAIEQSGAVGGQGGPNNLQRLWHIILQHLGEEGTR